MFEETKAKIIFIDAEFTGEHAYTTLVSLGVVTLDGQELYLTLNDFDTDQVTDWLSENVLKTIDKKTRVDSSLAYEALDKFLVKYSSGDPVYVVSCGLLQDYILMLELFKHANPAQKYFHALHCLPGYLNHYAAIDLNTLFRVCEIDPSINREEFANVTGEIHKHNALDDARVVRACFLKLMRKPPVVNLLRGLG